MWRRTQSQELRSEVRGKANHLIWWLGPQYDKQDISPRMLDISRSNQDNDLNGFLWREGQRRRHGGSNSSDSGDPLAVKNKDITLSSSFKTLPSLHILATRHIQRKLQNPGKI